MSPIEERLGYLHEVVDRQLAHAPKDKVASAYDRAQFLAERSRMMQDWADCRWKGRAQMRRWLMSLDRALADNFLPCIKATSSCDSVALSCGEIA
jgi:hypothetical protein